MTFHVHFTFPPSMTSHFLPHVIWRIEPNPLHITDAGWMIFPIFVLNMTHEISCYRICVVQVHDMWVYCRPLPHRYPFILPLLVHIHIYYI